MSRGVLYIASGEDYVEMSVISAKSVRQHMPDMSIAIVTDTPVDTDIFDEIIDLDSTYPDYGISTLQPDMSPFERTLYLDTDTLVTEPVYELFDVLDEHDMAFTQSPGRLPVDGLPDPWIEFNTGVIAYKQSTATKQFLNTWNHIHEREVQQKDTARNQPTFARTVYESDMDYFVLPREYNVRAPRFGYLVHKAKIVHGGTMAVPLEELAEKLNERTGPRVHWYYNHWNLKRDVEVLSENERKYSPKNIVHMFLRSVRRSGWRHAMRHSYLELKDIYRNMR